MLVKGHLTDLEYFQYRLATLNTIHDYQIKSAITAFQSGNPWWTLLSKFESFLNSGTIYSKTLSKIYQVLLDEGTSDDICRQRWKRNIGVQIQEQIWNYTHKNVLDISANIAIREAFIKLRNHWYLVPTRIHKIFSEANPQCWRCNNDLGTWLHIWWTCTKLKKFWKKIHIMTNDINIKLACTPENYLLHLFQGLRKNEMALLNNLVSAKMIIAKHWKSQLMPSIQEWQNKCQYTLLTHKLTAIKITQNGSLYAMYNFYSTWLPYTTYWNTIKPGNNVTQKLLKFW